MTTATSLQPGTLLQQREIYLSILKDLTIMDDIFMRNVLKDSACTEYILKVIMDQDNLKLEDQILQADYKNLQGRSSILDCIALDNSGRKYNIEFQNADSGASLKRARYHGSFLTIYLIPISFSLRQMIPLDSIYQSVTLTEHSKKPGSLALINYISSMLIHLSRMILPSADLCMTCIAPIHKICIARFSLEE